MEGTVCCPKCRSSKVVAEKRGFNAVKATAGGLIGSILGPFGTLAGAALAGTADQNQIYMTCASCGHQFAVGEGVAESPPYGDTQPQDATAPPRKRTTIDW